MNIPHIIEDTNLSNAWYRVVKHITEHSGFEMSPLVLTLTQFDEFSSIKSIINEDLLAHDLDPIDTVSETIFPNSLYRICKQDRQVLYRRYEKNLPRIKRIDRRNRKGTYFERLIAFGEVKKNQLEIIISSLQEDSKVKRRSKLQACTFDPLNDHSEGAFQGFPCLQHVTFYKSESGGLIINSFYAMQYLYQRAYGNWLGLINLGKFVAKETQLELERFNCFIGVEKLDMTKQHANELLARIIEEGAIGE